MDAEIPAYPFTPWTPAKIAEALARLPLMAEDDLRDLAECLAEGWQDLPEGMQGYVRAVQAELAGRRSASTVVPAGNLFSPGCSGPN